MKHLSAAVSLAIVLSACDGAVSRRSPTSPSPPSPSEPTYTLSGIVSLVTPTGVVPVEGVRVEETSSRQHAMTDSSGFYTISGLRAMNSSVSAGKSGYVTGTRSVTISGDTRFDIQIERVVTYTLSGIVFEVTPTGQTPIEGVELYCDGCGSEFGHTWAYTDSKGFYTFSWLYPGSQTLQVSKAGYRDAAGQPGAPPGTKQFTVTGDTRLDIELVRR